MMLMVPELDAEPWPSFGREVVAFLEDAGIYGPGSLQGQPYKVDPEFKAWLYRYCEVFPKTVTKAFGGGGPGLHIRDPHPFAGRRRFKRYAMSVRKGLAKTEKQALIVFGHIHPDGPARCDGFDASGRPVAAPIRSPYVPMLAYSLDQVEELAYGALKYIVENGPDADLFDVSLERIIRLDDFGREDGKAVPLAQSPNARDGARTTMNAFDEPHRMFEPRHLKAHDTMDQNLPKRPLEDPHSVYVGTAGKWGQGSVAEQLHREALEIEAGRIERPDLLYMYRAASDGYNLANHDERIKAIAEATGSAGEWGPGQFDHIASNYARPGADKPYWERVWLNRWVKHTVQAFDPKLIESRAEPGLTIPLGAFVAAGFDGARRRDATGLVLTDIDTGLQQLVGGWERPAEDDMTEEEAEAWEVDEAEVTQTVDHVVETYDLWRLNGDPPHWTETMGSWSAKHPDQIVEWWTNRYKAMAYALREYLEALDSGAVAIGGTEQQCADLVRHLTNAGRKDLRMLDDRGQPLWVLDKQDGDESLKFDYAMAAVLSWKACLEARKSGAKPRKAAAAVPFRIR